MKDYLIIRQVFVIQAPSNRKKKSAHLHVPAGNTNSAIFFFSNEPLLHLCIGKIFSRDQMLERPS